MREVVKVAFGRILSEGPRDDRYRLGKRDRSGSSNYEPVDGTVQVKSCRDVEGT